MSLKLEDAGPPPKSLKAGGAPPVDSSGAASSGLNSISNAKAAVEKAMPKAQAPSPKVVAKAAVQLPPGVISKQAARDLIILKDDTVGIYEHTRSSFNI